ncbi:hypothetical protein Tco_1080040 [Tanacetum coccineum]|uniref:Zinc finger, GRF-type n=1 Tax=Tanacetum coccineum TaxID=301880 RepID=A0ABQ5HTJ4_9ASTR
MVVCTCGQQAVDSNCPFLGWVDALMCPRSVEIIHGLLRRLNGLEEVVDLFEEQRSKYKKYIIIIRLTASSFGLNLSATTLVLVHLEGELPFATLELGPA